MSKEFQPYFYTTNQSIWPNWPFAVIFAGIAIFVYGIIASKSVVSEGIVIVILGLILMILRYLSLRN